jgi:hypothetical protein
MPPEFPIEKALPPKLEYLVLDVGLSAIGQLSHLTHLKYLGISSYRFHIFPDLPSDLEHLSCEGFKMNFLPKFSSKLRLVHLATEEVLTPEFLNRLPAGIEFLSIAVTHAPMESFWIELLFNRTFPFSVKLKGAVIRERGTEPPNFHQKIREVFYE